MKQPAGPVWAVFFSWLIVGGCATRRPDLTPPPMPAQFAQAEPAPDPSVPPPPVGAWWSIFDDAELDPLMRRLARDNLDYAAALRRIEEAVLLAALARTDRYPRVDYDLLAERRRNSSAGSGFNRGETRDSFEVPLTMDFDVDLFGRIRATIAARDADALAVEADTAGLLLALQARFASIYFGLQAVASEQAVLDRAVAVRRRALELTRARFQAGDVSEIDVSLAETELDEVSAERIGLDQVRIRLEHALAALMGAARPDLATPTGPLAPTPPAVAPAVPSEVLRRRPDIRAAERRVQAEAARLGRAGRLRFPALVLSGSAGFESEEIGDLFGGDSETWRATAEFSGPVFTAGADRVAVDLAETRLRRAELAYQRAVIEAVRECETALGAIRVLDRQIVAIRASAQSAGRTVALTEKQYRAGLVDYFEVVNAQRTELRNQQAVVRALAERYQALIDLILALGGGWDPPG